MTHTITTDGSSFSLARDGIIVGQWDIEAQIDSEVSAKVVNGKIEIGLEDNDYDITVIRAADTLTIDGDAATGTIAEKFTTLKAAIYTAAGGGSVTIGATSYDDNATALAALGAGVLYKSTTLINGSPIILITV